MNLPTYLSQKTEDPALQSIIMSIADAGIEIHAAISLVDTHKTGDGNATGDTQSPLDLTSDALLHDHLTATGHVRWIASEERAEIVDHKRGTYFTAYDPYDGGSVGDANITFGSIIGIWSDNPIGHSLETHLVAGCLLLYGPRTTLIVGTHDHAPACFEYDAECGTFQMIQGELSVSHDAAHFAPGNLNACTTDPGYRSCVEHWIDSGLKLRYSGALVTDINHILMKGDGIFTYPADRTYPTGRLRLLYEAGPISLLLENAGGSAYTEDGTRLLDVIIDEPHQRAPFFLGSRTTIEKAVAIMQKH